jgi:hypothetical protein
MHHRPRLILWLLLVAVTAFAFHNTGKSAGSSLETYPAGPDEFAPDINTLTGLQVADPAVLARSPFVVKISHAPAIVRPQAGIGAADLVYEHYAEGGLTRFSAIYYSQAPERVGSIRSARLIDYELLPMYQGLLAFSGASIGVEDILNSSEFSERLFKGVLYGRPDYWRDEAIPVPHNMFANLDALWTRAAEEGRSSVPQLHGLAFDPTASADSDGSASHIDIRYRATRVGWTYNAESGHYVRTADGLVHADANTGEQISAANVVVIYAEHSFSDIIESEWQGSISYGIEIKLWFEGDAIVFRDGQAYNARWLRPTREDMLSLRTMDGEVFYLKPGNTWFQVMRPPDQETAGEEWLVVES